MAGLRLHTSWSLVSPPTLLRSQPDKSTGNMLRDLSVSSKVDTKAVELDQLVAKLPTTKLLPVERDQLRLFIARPCCYLSARPRADGICFRTAVIKTVFQVFQPIASYLLGLS